jgi:gluconokinase
MNAECIITIELGTNAVRVFAFDLTGNVIASAKGSYPTFHSKPDYSEQISYPFDLLYSLNA